jgi:starch synthase
MKKILFAASEAVPFIKTGGLADVVGSLPKCFDTKYFDVRVIMPKYMCMKQEHKDMMEYVTHFYMDFNNQSQYVGVLTTEYKGITFYFIDNEYYFSGSRPYGNIREDIEKFIFFSKATLSSLPVIGFKPDIRAVEGPGSATLAELDAARQRARIETLAGDPRIKPILEHFPGARIVEVRADDRAS